MLHKLSIKKSLYVWPNNQCNTHHEINQLFVTKGVVIKKQVVK